MQVDLVTAIRFQYFHVTIKKQIKSVKKKNVEDETNWCRRKNVIIVLNKVSVLIAVIVAIV